MLSQTSAGVKSFGNLNEIFFALRKFDLEKNKFVQLKKVGRVVRQPPPPPGRARTPSPGGHFIF
jgi:hypothetical protein